MISNNSAVPVSDGGGTKILSKYDITRIYEHINGIGRNVKAYTDDLTVLINSFSNKEIVESFYASGNYGQETKAELEKYLRTIERYMQSILKLVSVTKDFCAEQSALNDKGL